MNVNKKSLILDILLQNKDEKSFLMNQDANDRIMKVENIDKLSKASTHFVFRDGPVEIIHCKGHLSDEEMKILNKHMVNRFAYLWTVIIQNRWIEFEYLVNSYDLIYGQDWDKAEIDDGGNVELIKMEILKGIFIKLKIKIIVCHK